MILADLRLLGRMAAVNNFSRYLSLQFSKGSVTEEAFNRLLESESKEVFLSAAAWKADGKAEISSVLTGRKQESSCYSINGQPEAVFGKTLLSGRYFLSGEESGCLIDQRLARALFGTDNAMGNKIQIGKKTYQVTGVLAGQNAICMIPMSKGENFDVITVNTKASGQSMQGLISMLEIYMGNTAERIIDGQFYAGLACIGFSLNLAALFIMLYTIYTRKLVSKLKQGTLKQIFKVMGLLAVLIILSVGIQYSGLSRDYLPTYWSDFGFYSELCKEKIEAVRLFASHQEFWHERQLLNNWIQVIAGSLILAAGQVLHMASVQILHITAEQRQIIHS